MSELIHKKEWYHKLDLCGTVTPGIHDPRDTELSMGFPKSFKGKRVLDVGCADGYYSFAAEKLDASEVVAIDEREWGSKTAKALLDSKVQFRIMSVYDLSPEKNGLFDIVILFGVLYHLKHPLLALEKIRAVCREYCLVESYVEAIENSIYPVMRFFPNYELNRDGTNWWGPNLACLGSMIKSAGFRPEFIYCHNSRACFKAHVNDLVECGLG